VAIGLKRRSSGECGLRNASNADIQYLTLFRQGANHLAERAATIPAAVKTADGFIVSDARFFDEFQLDAEDA